MHEKMLDLLCTVAIREKSMLALGRLTRAFAFVASNGRGAARMGARIRLATLVPAIGILVLPLTARAGLPAIELATAPLISPSQAWNYYRSEDLHTAGAAALSGPAPDIKALARGLGAERVTTAKDTRTAYSKAVYDYVRNNIAIEFRFGLSKGGRGALIDQSGTAFDQAELMVKLLREAGIPAKYVVGEIQMTTADFGKWTKIVKNLDQNAQTFAVDAKAACQFLADGGIPATINGESNCANVSGDLAPTGAVTIAHIWIDAVDELWDPAYKQHTLKAGIDLPAAMGCGSAGSPTCATQATTEAMTNVSTGVINGVPYIQRVNTPKLGAQLGAWAVNLESNIRTYTPTALVEDVVGGGEINTKFAPYNYTQKYAGIATRIWLGDIPDQYRTSVTVSYKGALKKFYADEIAGRNISIRAKVSASYIAAWSIYVDAAPVVTGPEEDWAANSVAGGGIGYSSGEPTVILDAPMPASTSDYLSAGPGYLDGTTALPVGDDRDISLFFGWGDATEATQAYYGDKFLVNPDPGGVYIPGPTDAPKGRDWPVLAAQYLHLQSAAAKIVGSVSHSQIGQRFTVGAVWWFGTYQGKGPIFTLRSLVSVNSVAGEPVSSPSVQSAFETYALTGSLLEGLVAGGTTQPVNISGVSSFSYSNSRNVKFINISGLSDLTSVMSSLIGYSERRKGNLTAIANGGYRYILPQEGAITISQRELYNNASAQYAYKSGAVAFLVNEQFKGGYGAGSDRSNPVQEVMDSLKQNGIGSKKELLDLSVANGVASLSPAADVTSGAGQFPYSLPFRRYYSSNSAVEYDQSVTNLDVGFNAESFYNAADASSFDRIGGGWTHNFQISARVGSDILGALGADGAMDASEAIATVYTLYDLGKSLDFQRRLTATFAASWFGSGLYYNRITLTNPPGEIVFRRLPSGVFNPRPGHVGALRVSGAAWQYSIRTTMSEVIGTNYGSLGIEYTDRDGAIMTFSSGARTVYHDVDVIGNPVEETVNENVFKIDSWNFPDGVNIAFQYADHSNSANNKHTDILKKISNNLGRSLEFSLSATQWPGDYDPPIFAFINSVTTDAGRRATFARSGCAGRTILCDVLTVTTEVGTDAAPLSAVTRYEYGQNSASPNPETLAKPTYRLRRVFTPSDQSAPYITFAYDELFRVRSVTDVLGHQNRYFLGGVGAEEFKRSEVIDPVGASSVAVLNRFGNPTSETSPPTLDFPSGRTTKYSYDNFRQRVRTEYPEGNAVEQTYDIRGNPLRTCSIAKERAGKMCLQNVVSGEPADLVTTTTYPAGCVVGVSCATGEAPRANCAAPYSAKTCNKPLKEIDARGGETDYEWHTNGQLKQVLSPAVFSPADNANVRPQKNFSYTGIAGISFHTGTVEKVSNGQSVTTAYAYEPANKYVLRSATVDSGSLNLTTTFAFDNFGNLIQVQDPLGRDKWYAWGRARNLTMVLSPQVDASRAATLYTYDVDALLTKVERGSFSNQIFSPVLRSSNEYDAAGRRTATKVFDGVSTALLALTHYSYDAADRLECTAVRLNLTTNNSACLASSATALGPDRITKKEYNPAGEITRVLGWLGGRQIASATYTYSANGKQQSVKDAEGNLTTLQYDGHDRLFKQRFPSLATEGVSSATDLESYEYDGNGNRTKLTKRDGSVFNFQFDSLNRMIAKLSPAGTPSVNYTYDGLGRMLSAADGSNTVIYTYDGAGRQKTEQVGGRLVTSNYDAAGNRIGVISSRSGAPTPDRTVGYEFDQANRLKRVTLSGVEVANIAYDALGRKQSLNRANGTKVGYDYDGAGRLNWMNDQWPLNTARNSLQTMVYNPASQVSSYSQSNPELVWAGHPATDTSITANRLNQDGRIAALSGGYDLNGNQRRDAREGGGQRLFTYDAENRLVRVAPAASPNAPTLDIVYDPLGRILKTTAQPGGADATVTQFLYDGDRLMGEYDAGGAELRSFVHGAGVDEPLVQLDGSGAGTTKLWLHTDRQGSVTAVSNDSQTRIGPAYTYGPFGEQPVWTGPRFRYTGQIVLADAQLYHYKARVYDPEGGRFLQTDPIGFDSGELNWYAYAGSDPVNKADPTGQFVPIVIAGVCAAGGCEALGAITAGTLGCLAMNCGPKIGQGLEDLLKGIFHNDDHAPPPNPAPEGVKGQIPDHWGDGKPTKEGGWEWKAPGKAGQNGDGVRWSAGNPNSKGDNGKGPNVKVTSGGQRLDQDGKPVIPSAPGEKTGQRDDTHIPEDRFRGWKKWNEQ